MKVIDHVKKSGGPVISFEIIPPLRGDSIERVMAVVEELQAYSPPFIDVTSHSAQYVDVKKNPRKVLTTP